MIYRFINRDSSGIISGRFLSLSESMSFLFDTAQQNAVIIINNHNQSNRHHT